MFQVPRPAFSIKKSDEIWLFAFVAAAIALLFHFLHDIPRSVVIAAVCLSFLALMTRRTWMLFFTALSFYCAASSVASLQAYALNLRWAMLGMCGISAVVNPGVSKSRPYAGRARLWPWVFIAFAFFSWSYSLYPNLTIQRTATLAMLFWVTTWFVKPFAAEHGVERVTSILIYAISPMFLLSLVMALLRKGFLVPQYTYQGLAVSALNPFNGEFSIPEVIPRFAGAFENPDAIGTAAAFFIPLVVHKIITGRRKFHVFLLGTVLVCLYLSASREGILYGFVSGGYVLVRNFGWRRVLARLQRGVAAVAALAAGLLILGASSVKMWNYFSRYARLKTLGLMGGRLEAWVAAFQIIVKHPFLGNGFGTEEMMFVRERYFFFVHAGGYVHNSILGLGEQVGILGTALFFIPVFLFVFLELRTKNPTPSRIALQGLLICGMLECLTESWIYSVGNIGTFTFWSVVAMLEYLEDTQSVSHVKVKGAV